MGLSELAPTVLSMNDDTDTDDETVAGFFDRYATALSAVDLDALAECYAYPSLAVSRAGTLAISEPDQTRAFFGENAERYTTAGITGVRIRNLRPAYDHDGLWVGLADLENLDSDGQHVGTELNAYQLVLRDGRWAIAVTTPLDAPA